MPRGEALRKTPELIWRAADLIKELRCSIGVVAESRRNLTAAGLVIEEADGFRYLPGDASLDKMVAALQQLYATKPTVAHEG